MRFQIFNCQSACCPLWSKGNCALLVPKHTQGATVNCQVYIIKTYIPLQALFYRIHKKIIKAVVVFLYIMKETFKGQLSLCKHTFLDANIDANICSPATKLYTCLLKYLEPKKTREIDDFCPSRVFFCINT